MKKSGWEAKKAMSSPLTPVIAGKPEPAWKVVVSFCLKSPPMTSCRRDTPGKALVTESSTAVEKPSGQVHNTICEPSPLDVPSEPAGAVEQLLRKAASGAIPPKAITPRRVIGSVSMSVS